MRHGRRALDQGFSLIELLVVMIVLGVLSAIVVYAIGSSRGDAVNGICKNDVTSIQMSAESIHNKDTSYPSTKGSMGGDNLLTPYPSAVLGAWPGGTSHTGTDDLDFTYKQTGGGTGYTLVITGKNLTGSASDRTLTQDATDSQVKAACSD